MFELDMSALRKTAARAGYLANVANLANENQVTTDPNQAELATLAGLAISHTNESDLSCWPNSEAMNTEELVKFAGRVTWFTDNGMAPDKAERLADQLVIRDRELCNMRLCLECSYLRRGRRCGNWERAGVAVRAQDARLPLELVTKLQHCDGFSDNDSSLGLSQSDLVAMVGQAEEVQYDK